ncbi:hypothetical protein DSECCO2_631790 [anaerobic digester metagenome]
MTFTQRFMNYFKVLLFCGAVVLTTQLVNLKGQMSLGSAMIGCLIIIAICLLSLLVGEVKGLKKIPPFAWASLLSLLLTTPWCPLNEVILNYIGKISTGQIGTVILAVAGVSIGTRLADVKRLSWKIVVISIFVFCGTFFGSALIAELVLKAQGII